MIWVFAYCLVCLAVAALILHHSFKEDGHISLGPGVVFLCLALIPAVNLFVLFAYLDECGGGKWLKKKNCSCMELSCLAKKRIVEPNGDVH